MVWPTGEHKVPDEPHLFRKVLAVKDPRFVKTWASREGLYFTRATGFFVGWVGGKQKTQSKAKQKQPNRASLGASPVWEHRAQTIAMLIRQIGCGG